MWPAFICGGMRCICLAYLTASHFTPHYPISPHLQTTSYHITFTPSSYHLTFTPPSYHLTFTPPHITSPSHPLISPHLHTTSTPSSSHSPSHHLHITTSIPPSYHTIPCNGQVMYPVPTLRGGAIIQIWYGRSYSSTQGHQHPRAPLWICVVCVYMRCCKTATMR